MASVEPLAIFAVSAPGLEPTVVHELAELGIEGRADAGGVSWEGGARELYAANLHLRTASRVVVRVAKFRARSFIELERHARRIAWSPYVGAGEGVRLRVTSRKSKLYHEGAIAERLARFIGESVGAAVAADNAHDEGDEASSGEQLFIVRFHRDECVVSADSSGALLHRRGYRQAVAKAPLRETLASALLLSCGWNGQVALIDPFCGSGTIPIEAALQARRIPPGLASAGLEPRAFAFHRWPGFDGSVWGSLLTEARSRIRDRAGVEIRGSDRDAGAIEAARLNAKRAGVSRDVEFAVVPLSSIGPVPEGSWLITNPPYGARMGEGPSLRSLYAAIGHVARERLRHGRIALVSGDETLDRQIGTEWTELVRTRNGGIPVRFLSGAVSPAEVTAPSRGAPARRHHSSRDG